MFATLAVGFALGLGLRTLPFVNGAVITDPLLASNQTFDYIVVGGGLAGLTVRSDPSTRLPPTFMHVRV
jgi:hypothetical protein